MKFLTVHPSCLMYSRIYLRLEPLGLELVAAAAERAGHSVRLIDLQCEPHRDFFCAVKEWRPDVIAQLADHRQPVKYDIGLPPPSTATVERGALYIHKSGGRSE